MEPKLTYLLFVTLLFCCFAQIRTQALGPPITSTGDVLAIKAILNEYPEFAKSMPSWNFSKANNDPCFGIDWVGISCTPVVDSTNNPIPELYTVTSLNFYEEEYSGPLPSFQLLKNLTSLIFTHSGITSFTADLFNSTTLQAVDLSYNNISGMIPPSLGSEGLRPPLKHLVLDFNEIDGPIPLNLSNLNISLFSAIGNYLSGPIDPRLFIGPWRTNITRFAVSMNELNGSIPSTIGNCTLLTSFVASGNQLTGTIPNLFNSSLNEFSVSNNNLSGTLEGLNNAQISSVWLSSNRFTGSLPNIGSELRYLDVKCNYLSGSIRDIFTGSKKILYAVFSRNNFTSAPDIFAVNTLYALPSTLEYLNFSCNPITFDWCGGVDAIPGQDICRGCSSGFSCDDWPPKLEREVPFSDEYSSGVLVDRTVASSSSQLYNWLSMLMSM